MALKPEMTIRPLIKSLRLNQAKWRVRSSYLYLTTMPLRMMKTFSSNYSTPKPDSRSTALTQGLASQSLTTIDFWLKEISRSYRILVALLNYLKGMFYIERSKTTSISDSGISKSSAKRISELLRSMSRTNKA